MTISGQRDLFTEIPANIKNRTGRLLRAHCTKELFSLIEGIEGFIGNSDFFTPIKSDTRRTVGIMKGDPFNLPFDLLIKQFNYRNRIDYHRRIFSRHNAKSYYTINIKLLERGLRVPEVVGFVESASIGKSYCLSRYVMETDNLARIYKSRSLTDPAHAAQHLSRTLAEWHLAGAVHGDLKWSNILLLNRKDRYEFTLVDLDQSKLYRTPSVKGMIRDLKRFYRYGLEVDGEQWVKSSVFPSYIQLLPDTLRGRIDLTSIGHRAKKEWTRKGKRKI